MSDDETLFERAVSAAIEADVVWFQTRHPEIPPEEIRVRARQLRDNYERIVAAVVEAIIAVETPKSQGKSTA